MTEIKFRKKKIAKLGEDYIVVIPRTYHNDIKKLGLEMWDIKLKKL